MAVKKKQKTFQVIKRTSFRGRTVYPKSSEKPAFSVSITPDKDGKTPFDGCTAWEEVVPKKAVVQEAPEPDGDSEDKDKE